MTETTCDVLIVGGGTGGCAAAKAATAMGMSTILTEETAWLGGQLTSQAVPPDEHPWIEQFGCTRSYRRYRDGVRAWYREHRDLTADALANPQLNPGGGWVSRLCHEPQVGVAVLEQMLTVPLLDVRLQTVAIAAETDRERVLSVLLRDNRTGDETLVRPKFVLDATELGDLLPMTGTEYVVGAESRDFTGEPNAPLGPAQPENCQAITWVFAMAHDRGSNRTIGRPHNYDRWGSIQPAFWPGPLIGEWDLNPSTGQPRKMPFWSDSERFNFFTYRQILDPSIYVHQGEHPVTIVNWPQNDYFEGTIIDVDDETKAQRLREAKELSLSLLYWLQTEMNLPGLYLRPDITGTEDGFAMAPYIRESRRIVAQSTVREHYVSAALNPDQDRAAEISDSVGIGAYRIDLHPSTGGDGYIDLSSLPFQIPLGSLIPVRLRNLLPACKNLGVTHITNGCYRLHPVEWNIGEAAGYLAAFCIRRGQHPTKVWESSLLTEYQALLKSQGVELEWPKLRAL